MEEYISVQEAMSFLGVSKRTIYLMLARIDQSSVKFEGDRRHFLGAKQVTALKTLKAQPWKAEQLKQSLREEKEAEKQPENSAA